MGDLMWRAGAKGAKWLHAATDARRRGIPCIPIGVWCSAVNPVAPARQLSSRRAWCAILSPGFFLVKSRRLDALRETSFDDEEARTQWVHSETYLNPSSGLLQRHRLLVLSRIPVLRVGFFIPGDRQNLEIVERVARASSTPHTSLDAEEAHIPKGFTQNHI